MSMFDIEKYISPENGFHSGDKKAYTKDDRYWKITKDEHNKGVAVIRLLPDYNMRDYVKLFSYTLKKPKPNLDKKFFWYIANSPASIGLPDPVAEYYQRLIEEGTKEAKDEAAKLSRKTDFITNILVVKDAGNPENEGKVFLWKYGVKMASKFDGWINPSKDDREILGAVRMNLRHPLEGYNIILKIRPDQHSFTYEDSTVVPTASKIHPKIETEEQAMAYLKANTYDLSEFTKPEFFESYEELKIRFEKWLESGASPSYRPSVASAVAAKLNSSPTPSVEEADEMPDWMAPKKTPVEEEQPKSAKPTAKATPSVDDDEDTSWMDALDD